MRPFLQVVLLLEEKKNFGGVLQASLGWELLDLDANPGRVDPRRYKLNVRSSSDTVVVTSNPYNPRPLTRTNTAEDGVTSPNSHRLPAPDRI